jgi:hypothetical protein
MDLKIIEERLKSYKPQTMQEEKNALREIAQAIALCGLARANYWRLLFENGLWASALFRRLGFLDASTIS